MEKQQEMNSPNEQNKKPSAANLSFSNEEPNEEFSAELAELEANSQQNNEFEADGNKQEAYASAEVNQEQNENNAVNETDAQDYGLASVESDPANSQVTSGIDSYVGSEEELQAMDAYEGSEALNAAWEEESANSEEFGAELAPEDLNPENFANSNQPVPDWDEEYSAELTADHAANHTEVDPAWGEETQTEDRDQAGISWIGWASLATGIISLFAYPAFLAPVSIIGGIISYWNGNRALGGWSVAIGFISLIMYFIFLPFVTF